MHFTLANDLVIDSTMHLGIESGKLTQSKIGETITEGMSENGGSNTILTLDTMVFRKN